MPQLTDAEVSHAKSIADLEPILRPIPQARVTRLLIASPVRKPPVVVEQLLRTIQWQQVRGNVHINTLFVPNFGDEPFKEDAITLLLSRDTTVWPNQPVIPGDYGERSETRAWTKSAFDRMATLKNRVLQYAMDEAYDFVWLLDADVLCDPFTLQSLLDSANHERWRHFEGAYRAPIVAGVYWTRWQRPHADSTERVHAGPQVWLVHPYQLSGRGWIEPDFRRALIERQRTQVWGLGACTLVPVAALRAGVSFAPYAGLPAGPMSEGEDRHFCAHATARHIDLIADPWPDIVHAYHPAEYEGLAGRVDALERAPESPSVGSLVSAMVEMLEPVVDGTGRLTRLGPRWIRGRFGTLPVLPQIEEAIGTLTPGKSKLTKLHFPAHWPEAQLRNQSLVARISLFDVKPFGLAPVIDEELLVGATSGRLIDTTTMARGQLDEMAAVDG